MKGQTNKRTVNGVDVRRLRETIQAINETPSLANSIFRIANE